MQLAKRICTKCKAEKELEKDYFKCPKNKQRRKTICKTCLSAYDRLRDAKKRKERELFY